MRKKVHYFMGARPFVFQVWLCLPMLMILVLLASTACKALADPSHETEYPLDFSIFRMGTGSPVVLVVGGIQGDEPGGFSAATLLSTRYQVTQGSLWVVPNLNFPSILRRSRGLHGDMNRKFAVLDSKDPEFPTVTRIQELIRAPEVVLVLNLHDGSGYYRPKREGPLHNPARWGQSVIIDQAFMPNVPSGVAAPKGPEVLSHLQNTAEKVLETVNTHLLTPKHRLFVRNTRTAEGNREMEKSLSWYAVQHGKPAFGLEASKEFSVETRVYYHLRMVEEFVQAAGIRMKRDFALTPQGVRAALQSGLSVAFAGNRIMLPLEDVRPRITMLPLPRRGHKAIASKPIMAVLPNAGILHVHYGNRTLTRIDPDWHDMDNSLDGLRVMVDDREQFVSFGQVVQVQKKFKVLPVEGHRVNAIGAEMKKGDESGLDIQHSSFKSRYSVDNRGTLFRVEVYKGQSFSGMFLVRFGSAALLSGGEALPDSSGKKEETPLGY